MPPVPSSGPPPPAAFDRDFFYPQENLPFEVIQGGGTVKTYKMPPHAERCQYVLKTNGRPLKATVQLWLGPIRQTHQMIIDVQNGQLTPFQATLKFKKAEQVLKIHTSEEYELPVLAAVKIPTPEESKALGANTDSIWESCSPDEKLLIQGGGVGGGGGAIRSWNIPDHVESVQVLAWSKDVGRKSLRCNIEVLQGPNTKLQEYTLQCGGGTQPYHATLQTPGPGWVVRLTNKKFVEDGLFQFAVVPLDVLGGNGPPPVITPTQHQSPQTPFTDYSGGVAGQWWN